MIKRTVVVTGANKGIGYSIVDQLLSSDTYSKIIMTSRSQERGQEAIDSLTKLHGEQISKKLVMLNLDLLCKKSISNFTKQLKDQFDIIDCIIHNAGLLVNDTPTDEAFHQQWNTNYINTRFLNEKILEEKILKDKGKIIFVSSGYGSISLIKDSKPEFYKRLINYEKLTIEEIDMISEEYKNEYLADQENRNGWGVEYSSVYGRTKLFLSLYCYALAHSQNILDREIQVYNLTPGMCLTGMTEHMLEKGLTFHRTQQKGAETPVYLANLPFSLDMEKQGQFFFDLKISSIAKEFDFSK